MQHNWSRYLRYIIGGLIGSTLVGLYFGEPVYGLTLGLIVYLWWTLLQARRLYQWLSNPSATDEAPRASACGAIFSTTFTNCIRPT